MVTAGEVITPLATPILAALISELGCLTDEALLVVHLDKAGAFIGDELFPNGSKCSLGLPYRQLFHQAFKRGTAGLLLAHNHPSGAAKPSDLDVVSTRGLQALARPMEMHVVDHLIVGGGTVFSMRAAGLLI